MSDDLEPLDLFIGTSNMFELKELHNNAKEPEDVDYYVVNATVTGELRAEDDTEVIMSGIPMPYDSAAESPATYRGTLPHTVELEERAFYYVRYTAVVGGVRVLFRRKAKAKFYEGSNCGCF